MTNKKFQVIPKRVTVVPAKVIAPIIEVTQKDIDNAAKHAKKYDWVDRHAYCPIGNALVRTLNLKRSEIQVEDEEITVKDITFITTKEIKDFIDTADQIQLKHNKNLKLHPIKIDLTKLEIYDEFGERESD